MSDDKSLGDQNTFAGGGPQNLESKSLGDEVTYGGDSGSDDDLFDDGMEVGDLESRYKTEGILGQGGMGEVLLATDTRLERKVAIKRILGSAARSKTAVNRFLTEAKSIAALNHPNIVQIYDYGRAKDGPFLIMEYVEGSSLLDKCREGAIPLQEAIDLTCQLCDGLEKAHAANIIHRDIKPANVLLTPDGVPKLTDFGLAKAETADTGMTMAGAVLGTLDFMPPEQRRDAALVDARSDLWALAATFYQMVTGKSPKTIRFNHVPRELHDVLDKALEEDPEERFQTAAEFRDALRESVGASLAPAALDLDLGAGECLKCKTRNDSNRKFCRECAAALRVICPSCEAEIPVWDKVCGECGGKQMELLVRPRAELDAQREKAESLRSQLAFDEAIQIAIEIGAIKDIRLQHLQKWSAEFITATAAEKEQQEELAAKHYAEARTHRTANDYQSAIHAMETIPEPMQTTEMSKYLVAIRSNRDELGELLKTISSRVKQRDLDGLLKRVFRALELGGERSDLVKLQSQLTDRREKHLAQRDKYYLEAEKLLVQGEVRKAYARVNAVKTTELSKSNLELKKRLKPIVQAEADFSALLKEAKADGVLDPGEVVALLASSWEYLQLNPKHEQISKLHNQLINQVNNSSVTWQFRLAKLPPEALQKLPSEVLQKLPSEVLQKLPIEVLKTEGWAKLPSEVWAKLPLVCITAITAAIESNALTFKGHSSIVYSVAYSPDGNSIVSGSWDDTVKILDAKTGKEKLTLKGHTANVFSVAFSPDGNSIVSGSSDATIKFWDAKTGKEKLTLEGHSSIVYSVAYSPDGNSIVNGSGDRTIKFWDAKTGKEKLTLKGHTKLVHSVAFSPDGNSIVSGSYDKTIKIWDAKTGKKKLTLKGHTNGVNSVAYSPDGNSIVSGSGDKTIKFWDAKTGKEELTLKGHAGSVHSVAFSPDGNSIVSGSDTIKIWDAKTGKEELTLQGHTSSVWSVAFSPDGNSIVSGSNDSTIKIWNLTGGTSR